MRTITVTNYNQIFMFTEIAKALNISKVADSLGVSKSHVSKQLSELESNLGTKLIERSTRNLVLTEQGQRLYQDTHLSFAKVAEVSSQIYEKKERPEGELRISAPIEFGQYLSKMIVPSFMESYPDISLTLTVSPEQKDLLKDKFDLLIRVGKPDDSSYIYRKIIDARLNLFCSPRAHKELNSIKDLEKMNWISMGEKASCNPITILQGKREFSISPNLASVRCNNLTVMKNLIAEGQGIGFLPEFIFRDEIKRGEIVRAFPDLTSGAVPIGFLYASRKHTPPKIKVFIDHVNQLINIE